MERSLQNLMAVTLLLKQSAEITPHNFTKPFIWIGYYDELVTIVIVINVVIGGFSLEIGSCNCLITGARFTANCPILLSEHNFAD